MDSLKMHISAVHPATVPAKQEKAKLPTLLVSDGVVTETSLGMFKQQLSYLQTISWPVNILLWWYSVAGYS